VCRVERVTVNPTFSESDRIETSDGKVSGESSASTECNQAAESVLTGRTASDELAAKFLQSPPKELGVMLVSAGVIGFVLPGPGVPALVAGGLILWPKGFGKAEGWLRRRFPAAHRTGMAHIGRFLSDLERRYPGSTGSGSSRG
jgi:hypothetical protein